MIKTKTSQNGFTQHLVSKIILGKPKYNSAKAEDLEPSAGFIPMMIIFLLVIAVVIYLAFTQVLNHQK